ncbi:unnamed protein product [Didymodactylos carnosus]|uniref:Cytochrome P450 n=1 Tax=Didymodactylos carnosus TaxID=1234261 RepID=A0A815LYN0_9BILA|nr:unnamed protein product [Didymodactylos carnosus]CAF4298880.1 unnamed protein product [Didymodactylos carnosus]
MSFYIILLQCLLVLFLTYFYFKRRYYTKCHITIPGYEPEFLIGSIRKIGLLKGLSLWDAFRNQQEKFGDLYQMWLGAWSYTVFCRPEDAEYILSTNRKNFDNTRATEEQFELLFPTAVIIRRGLDHKRISRIILPLLRKYRIVPYMNNIIEQTDKHLNVWKKMYGQSESEKINRNIIKDYSSLAMEIIGIIAFDHNFKLINKPLESASEKIDQKNMTLGVATANLIQAVTDMILTPLPGFLKRLKLILFSSTHKRSLTFLHNYINHIIEEYHDKQKITSLSVEDESKPAIRQNLLSMLLSSLKEEDTDQREQGITKQELIDNLALLIFAGYETTATVLSWFTYFVSKRPEVQQKMKDEIRIHCGSAPLTTENIQKLGYVDCVLKETLRLAPTAVAVSRQLPVDDTINGISMRKGENVMIAIACLHTDPRNWKLNPNEFLPERFYGSDAPDSKHHPYALLPFGGGPHACAGQDLARLELKLIMIRLMQSVTFLDAPGNNGGHIQHVTVIPKSVAVYIKFDD